MRQKESRLVSLVLYVLVSLSLFLTWRILAIPSQTLNLQPVAPTVQSPSISTTKDLEEVFVPNQMAVHTDTHTYITKDTKILKDVNRFLTDWKMKDLSFLATYDSDEFNDLVLQTGRVEVKFPAAIHLDLISRYFEVLPEGLSNEMITRILLSPQSEDEIYLVNDDTKKVYTAQKSEKSIEPLLAIYTKNVDEFIPANAYAFSNGIVFMPQERVTVPVLVYLAEKQPTSFFINELFDDTTELRDNSDDLVISYSDNISELRISKDSGILYYYRNNLDRTSILPYRQVRNSFHELKFLDTWPGLSLYDGYDSVTDQITYRRYVNGIPIYDTKGMGAIRMKMANSGSTEIQFPTQIIQTPLEDRQKNIELPMGEEVIETLERKGYSFSDIEMIEVAYEWSNSDESNRIVELTPRWFVKMKGTWRTLDSWLIAMGEETEHGF